LTRPAPYASFFPLMRFVAAFFLLASIVIHLLLGVAQVLSSKYQEMKAQDEAGDLSSVAGDLDVDKATLDRMHAEAKAKTVGAGRRELLSGIGLAASAVLQILALVLLLVRRARPLALALTGLGLAGLIAYMLVDHFLKLGLLNAVLLVLALGSGLLARGRAPLVTTT
jgi:hypothetical protein